MRETWVVGEREGKLIEVREFATAEEAMRWFGPAIQ